MTMLVALEPFLEEALLHSKLDMHEHDNTIDEDEEADETLSFSDLPLYSNQKSVEEEEEEWNDQEEDLSTESQGSSSISSSASSQDYFEFFSQEFSPSFLPDNIIFCGKLIPYKQSSEKDRSHSSVPHHQTKTQLPNHMEKKQGWARRIFKWNFSSTRSSNSKINHQVESRKAYDFPVNKMSILTSSSSGKAAKWQLLFFGISRVSSKVEIRDMKSRQSRSQFSPPSRFQKQEQDEEKSSSRNRGYAGLWGLIKVLSCGGNNYPNAMVVPSILPQEF